MPSFCTCGAQLPPDARFCHKCGKPQSDLLPVEEAAEVIPEVPVVVVVEAPKPLDINFRNPLAVRTALITAMVASILISLPIPPAGLWPLIALLLSGFLAVFFYVRRTGQTLTVIAGARMGWITGLFSFIIAIVFFTLAVLSISSKGGFPAFYREFIQQNKLQESDFEQFLQILQTPTGLGAVIFLMLVFLFVTFTIFPTLGGVLGAKIFERNRA